MADIHWITYVGSVTGVLALLISFFNHMKVSRLGCQDTRIELRHSLTDVHTKYGGLQEKLLRALKSRQQTASALGLLNSGMLEKFQTDFEIDQQTVRQLLLQIPLRDKNFKNHNYLELEDELIAVHTLHRQLQAIDEKYSTSLKEDKESSDMLHRAALETARV